MHASTHLGVCTSALIHARDCIPLVPVVRRIRWEDEDVPVGHGLLGTQELCGGVVTPTITVHILACMCEAAAEAERAKRGCCTAAVAGRGAVQVLLLAQ